MAVCRRCGKNVKYSGNTSNLDKHLKSHDQITNADCETSTLSRSGKGVNTEFPS